VDPASAAPPALSTIVDERTVVLGAAIAAPAAALDRWAVLVLLSTVT
jgi:hypothetical protein